MKIKNADELIRFYINHGTIATVSTIQQQNCLTIVRDMIEGKTKTTSWTKAIAEHLLTELQSIYC